MIATWVPGKLVAPNTIEFERKRIWWDGKKYPDVLVFDKNYELKYALDGNPAESVEKQGYVYPWSRSHFVQIDPRNGRVRVNVDIAEDDIVFGFYFYEELDLIYTALDINPFTNPAMRNKIVEFVHRDAPDYPERHIWHRRISPGLIASEAKA
jgi:hypothetical protein